jgi:hypothetical protein
MLIRLPNGIVEGLDHFNMAEIDELRGKQQNYLADKELVVGNIGHIPKILRDMLLSLQTEAGVSWKGDLGAAISRLPSSDLETILIKVRENTYGSRFYHEGTCPYCGHIERNLRLDLDNLIMEPLEYAQLIVSKHVMLPKSKVEAELKPLYLEDLFKIIDITQKSSDSLITSIVALSIKKLGEKTPVTAQDLDSIPASDLMALQEYMKQASIEGTIDTNIELDCSECKKEFSLKLNCFEPSFFDPTRGSMTSNS